MAEFDEVYAAFAHTLPDPCRDTGGWVGGWMGGCGAVLWGGRGGRRLGKLQGAMDATVPSPLRSLPVGRAARRHCSRWSALPTTS